PAVAWFTGAAPVSIGKGRCPNAASAGRLVRVTARHARAAGYPHCGGRRAVTQVVPLWPGSVRPGRRATKHVVALSLSFCEDASISLERVCVKKESDKESDTCRSPFPKVSNQPLYPACSG